MSKVQELLGKINAAAKKRSLDVPAFQLSGEATFQGRKIATGNASIDRLFHGGFPCGRIIEIFGGESSGKTSTTLHMIAGAQRAGDAIAVFIDAEHALDLEYAKRIGVDPAGVIIQQPDYGEQALELVKLACEAYIEDANPNKPQLIVCVDSVAALVPKSEFDANEIGASGGMARQAAMMSSALRQLIGPISKSNACVVFINQTREKVGVSYGDPTTTPAGRALKFYSSLRVKTARAGKCDFIEGGAKLRLQVVKSKLFPPFKSCEVYIGNDGIDAWASVAVTAIETGVVKKSGAWIKYGNETVGQGINGFADKLRADSELAQKIVNAIHTPPSNEAVRADNELSDEEIMAQAASG